MEDRYDFLLARVGKTLSSNANLPKLLTVIALFSDEKIVTMPEVPPQDVNKVRSIQVSLNFCTTFAKATTRITISKGQRPFSSTRAPMVFRHFLSEIEYCGLLTGPTFEYLLPH